MKKYLKLLFVSVEPLKMVLLNLLPNLCVVTNDDKINVVQKLIFMLQRTESIVQKGESPGKHTILPCQKLSYFQMYEVFERKNKNGLLTHYHTKPHFDARCIAVKT